MSIPITATIQSQMLQVLLRALQSGDKAPGVGETVKAEFVSWNGTGEDTPESPSRASTGALPPGFSEATIRMAGKVMTLQIEATPERRALMQPGSTLTLQVEVPALDMAPARMRLVSVGPPDNALQMASSAAGKPSDLAHANLLKAAASPAETLRAAAGPIIGAALARQDGLGPLFADLEVLVRAPSALPGSVIEAAAKALAARGQAEQLSAQPGTLRALVRSSGLFHEAMAATGAVTEAASDLKAALLGLRQALREALAAAPADEAAVKLTPPDQAAHARAVTRPGETLPMARTPAPTRDGLPLPQGLAAPSLDAGTQRPEAMLARALDRTESALDRLSISQFASLPAPSDAALAIPQQRWITELPLALDGRTAILPIEIEEDGGGASGPGPQAKLWRIRFALDVEPMGPVHALVTMQGRSIGVTVWAERDATTRLVKDHAADLRAALLDSDFDNPSIEVLAGQPMKRAAHAGHYLDRRS